jgi:hypothetical protein
MKRNHFLKTFFPLGLLLLAKTSYAVCPVCVVAVGAGVGLSRWLGVDDTITGVWIGGLTLSVALWTIDWLKRKNFHFHGRRVLVIIAYYILIYVSLVWTNVLGHPLNKLWGYDKLSLGILVGSIFLFLGNIAYITMKRNNNDRVYFPFQKVIMPVSSLVLASIIFYIIIK